MVSDCIAKMMGGSREEITRDSQDRTRWRKLVRGATRVADHHSPRARYFTFTEQKRPTCNQLRTCLSPKHYIAQLYSLVDYES